ncbi:MAG: diguanylate cyclase [Candidatus Sericytochromatia bacterium]|nr:diguanylate cyclase [Candidatus Sericytochromatia bacterium]
MDDPRLPFSPRYALVEPLQADRSPAFRVRDTRDGQEVCWQSLPASEVNPTRLSLAHAAWSEVAHPAAVRPGEWGTTDGGEGYVTAGWVDGTAATALAPLPPLQVERLLSTLAEALGRLHARGWLHGSLRPDSLLIDDTGQAVLTGWHRLMLEGEAPLPPVSAALPYVAPEVLRGGRPDRRADVYSLGAVAHALLTGAPPHDAPTPAALREAVLTQPVHRFSGQRVGIPPGLDQVITAMLAKDPAARPRDMAAVREALGHPPAASGERALGEAPLAGHGGALERFEGLLQGLGEGLGEALWLHGAEGVGRTRVAEACVARAQLAGLPVVALQGAHHIAPWGAWRRLLEAVLPLARARAGSTRAGAVSGVLEALDELCLRPPTGAQQQDLLRARLRDASLDAIGCAAAEGGLVVVVDDFDRLDAGSQAALVHVQQALCATSASPVGMVVLAGHGPQHPGWQAVELDGLDEASFGSWLAAVMGGAGVPPRFAAALHAHAAGRPGIARLALRHLISQGVVASHAAGFRLPEVLWAGALPASGGGGEFEQHLIAALSDDARALGGVLALAPSVALHLEVAAQALDVSTPQVVGAARQLLASGLVALRAEGLALTSNGARAAFLAHTEPATRASVLTRLRALVASGKAAEAGPWQGLLDRARLMLAPPAAEGAAPVGLEAARRCLAAGALPEARALFEEVADHLRALPAPADPRLAVEVGLGLLACHAEAAPTATELVDQARRAVAAQPDHPGATRLLLAALWHTRPAGPSDDEAAGRLEELAAVARRLGEADMLDALTLEEAHFHLEAGRRGSAADAVAGLLADRDREGGFAWLRALALRGQLALEGDAETQAAGFDDLVGAAAGQARIGDHRGLLDTLGVMVAGGFRLGRWADATAWGARLLALSGSHAEPQARNRAAAASAASLLELGQPDEALRMAAQVVTVGREADDPSWRSTAAALRFGARVLLGHLVDAERDLEEALPGLAQAPAGLRGLLTLCCVRGLLVLGRMDEAARLARELLQQGAKEVSSGLGALPGHLALAEVSALGGDPLASHSFAEQAHQAARETQVPHWLARAATQRALAALQAEAYALAIRHALEAEQQALACKGRILVAEARLIAGEAALRSGGSDAAGHFQVTRMIADATGATVLRACALDGLGRCSPLAPEASSYLADAQRILRQASKGLGEGALALFEGSRQLRHIFDRRAGEGGLSMTSQTHRSMLDRLGRLSAELTGVTASYGLMIDAWGAKREQLRKLNELARTINGSLELDDVAHTVLQVALALTGAERAYILLKTQGRYEDLLVRAGRDRHGRDVLGQQFSMSICLRVAATGEAAALMDGAGAEGLEPGKSVAALNLKTVMCAPLMVKGRCMGVLYVDSQAVLKAYTLQDLDQLSAIAAHASIALDNALLYDSLKRHTAELEKTLVEVRKAEAAAGLDALTGLRNRRAFMATADRELALAKRQGRSLAVVLLDVDHFKRFNDDFGHSVGDEVLRLVGGCLLQAARETDLPARLGGEEFAVLCPETDPASAMTFAERLRAQIADLTPSDRAGRPLRSITASLGVAGWTPEDATVDVVLARADRALYEAKDAGRNQCRLAVEKGAGKP